MDSIQSAVIPSGGFYARDTIEVAVDLLGKILSNKTARGHVGGRIVEVEAYLGEKDPACHASSGMTGRTKMLWGNAGLAYIYVNYGIHHCLNVTTEKPGTAGCVLIRALEPVEGLPVMKENRRTDKITDLTNGPGKLTQALGITLAHNGADLSRGNLVILSNGDPESLIRVTPRIGISKAINEPLRFFIKDNKFVSYPKRKPVLFEGPIKMVKKAFRDQILKVSFK